MQYQQEQMYHAVFQKGHYHPTFPGFWLHPMKGTYHLEPDEEHGAFFMDHPCLFGPDLTAAYADGWVSIRRCQGDAASWAIIYGHIEPVRSALGCWARILLARWPEEAAIPVETATLLDSDPLPTITLGELPGILGVAGFR